MTVDVAHADIPADAVVLLGADHVSAVEHAPSLDLDAYDPAHRANVLRRWLREWVTGKHTRLAFLGRKGQETEALGEVCRQHYVQFAIDELTVEKRASTWATHFLRNLRTAERFATMADRPLAGRVAVVVSAGPSLDRNGWMLPDLQMRGAVVITSNTAAGCCREHGCQPDYVVCAESKDVRGGLVASGGASVHCLELASNPANWTVAALDHLAVNSHEPNLMPYTLRLGALPLNFGGSVACACTSLAIMWGASHVVLVGQDLSYAGDGGAMYATGSPYSDMSIRLDGGELRYVGGTKGSLAPTPHIQAPGWGGGTVTTTHNFLHFARWFEKAAACHSIVNSTEGGLHLDGMLEVPLSLVLSGMSRRARYTHRPPPDVPLDARLGVLRGIRERAEWTLAHIGELMTPPADFPILNLWAVPAIIAANNDTAAGFDARRAYMRDALERGCTDILEAIGDAS